VVCVGSTWWHPSGGVGQFGCGLVDGDALEEPVEVVRVNFQSNGVAVAL
jgi:hypothetical protein